MLLYVDLDMSQISEGYVILATGLGIIFTALTSLFLIFRFVMPLLLYIYKVITKGRDKKIEDIAIEADEDLTGEIIAAISTGIHMYLNEQHDDDHPILMIKKAKKQYSPWSSKIYGVMNNPVRK